LLRKELQHYIDAQNAYKSRKDHNKIGPSGCSRNNVFLSPENYGLKNCLFPLTEEQVAIVREIKEAMGGEKLIAFVSEEFDACAEAAYLSLEVLDLTFSNVWHVFQSLLILLSPPAL